MAKLTSESRPEPMKAKGVTLLRIEMRDRMARYVALALKLAKLAHTPFSFLHLSEPNLIEIKASDGTVYTLRVCRKRGQR